MIRFAKDKFTSAFVPDELIFLGADLTTQPHPNYRLLWCNVGYGFDVKTFFKLLGILLLLAMGASWWERYNMTPEQRAAKDAARETKRVEREAKRAEAERVAAKEAAECAPAKDCWLTPTRELHQFTAATLAANFRANEVRTDKQIDGRWVVISGQVESVSKVLGKEFVELRAGTIPGAQLMLAGGQADAAAALNPGQPVKILCKAVAAGVFQHLTGSDCYVKYFLRK